MLNHLALSPSAPGQANIIVSNIAKITMKEDIIKAFSPYVKVDSVFAAQNGKIAFVNTYDKEGALNAIKALHKTSLHGTVLLVNKNITNNSIDGLTRRHYEW